MEKDQETFNRLAGKRNLYQISQSVNRGYDTYSDAVVAAWTEDEARNIHPGGPIYDNYPTIYSDSWALPNDVEVRLIGIGEPGIEGIVCASFHAG